MEKMFGKFVPSAETVNIAINNLNRPEKEKHPLAVAYYLTFQCNAACTFCSQGEQVYGSEKNKYRAIRKDNELAYKVLAKIREDVPNIYFMGGEPTVHPGFDDILEEASFLDFDLIAVNTNARYYRESIAKYANMLVISLHSEYPSIIEDVYRIPDGKGNDVLSNVYRYFEEVDRNKTRIILNCVATGKNIYELIEVAKVCIKEGVEFNIAPAICQDGSPDPDLLGNPDYIAFLNWLMELKGVSSNSQYYLQTIRDFTPFECNPHVIPGVHPNGDLIVPCPNLPQPAEMVNILTSGGVINAQKIGRAKFEASYGVLDTRRDCANKCHKTCYIEMSKVGTVDGVVDLMATRIGARLRKLDLKHEIPSPPGIGYPPNLCDSYYHRRWDKELGPDFDKETKESALYQRHLPFVIV